MPSSSHHYVYDSENCIFEIMGDFDLRPCGKMVGLVGEKAYCGVSFHPYEDLVAFVTEKGMTVSDFYGNHLWDYEALVVALIFSRDGEEIWIAEKQNEETLFVAVVDAKSGMENSANTFEDPIYDSHPRFCHAPDTVLMELAAGQDGIEVWEFDDTDSALQYRKVFPGYGHLVPVFHPDSRRLLTLDNDDRFFYTYTWPDETLIAKQDSTKVNWDDTETINDYYFEYLKNGLAFVQSFNYRFYLFDPTKMERLEELVIEGFEPRQGLYKELYPNTKEDGTLHSPLQSFERTGNVLLARTCHLLKNQATVLIAEDDLIKQISIKGFTNS